MINKFKKFVTEVIIELKKVSWTTRSELIDATWIVIMSALFLGFYVAGADWLMSKFLGLIIR